MNEVYIKLLTDKLIKALPNSKSTSLLYGEMGICIYLFILSRYRQFF